MRKLYIWLVNEFLSSSSIVPGDRYSVTYQGLLHIMIS